MEFFYSHCWFHSIELTSVEVCISFEPISLGAITWWDLFIYCFVSRMFKTNLYSPLQLAVICICVFVILPLTLVGTVLGRNLAGQPNYPCRINAVPRPIPEKKWFMEPLVIIPLGGILPFGSIFIEMWVVLLLSVWMWVSVNDTTIVLPWALLVVVQYETGLCVTGTGISHWGGSTRKARDIVVWSGHEIFWFFF